MGPEPAENATVVVIRRSFLRFRRSRPPGSWPPVLVGPVYGLAILSDRPEAARLALFMLSEAGQAIIAQGGLLPVVAER